MPTCSIQLPVQLVSSRQGDVEIRVNTTVTIDLPLGHSNISSLHQLTRAIERREIWIARVGPCHLSVSTSSLDEPLTALERNLVQSWIQDFPVRSDKLKVWDPY